VSLPDDVVSAQLQGLLERLERDRERRCAAELAGALERAGAIERAAHAEARRRIREATRYERRRLAEALALRRAELEARSRRKQHDAVVEILRRARDRLPAALERRWSDPVARREWCEAALAGAARHLCAADWTIEIAAGPNRAECDALLARAVALRTGAHTLRENGDLRAGLTVRAAGAALDASATGLLDDVAAIGARVLREWLRDRPQNGAAVHG
jgi:hypothetical protein